MFPGALALLSDGHRAAVLAHARWIDIAQKPDPVAQLVWMVEHGLLTYDELDELQTLEEEPSENDRLVEEAFAELARLNKSATGRMLDQLLADRLITPAQHAATLASPPGETIDNAAGMLLWIVHENGMSASDFDLLHAAVLLEPASAANVRRQDTVRSTCGMLREIEALTLACTLDRESASRRANWQLAGWLVFAVAATWFLAEHWPA
ncbi:MAG: hypothetical protein EOO64_03015 [Massilia sp.]|nr:MAG: hypothetical protein EOO64_03015 [Massilia sp.]